MNIVKKLFYYATGGRPMKRESSGSAFFDGIAKKSVFFFRDRLHNVRYLANHKWQFARVKCKNQG